MADPEWVKFPFIAGQYPDETPGEAKLHWKDGSWIDFEKTEDGKTPALTVQAGWEKYTSQTFAGKIRKILQYTTNAGYPVAALLGGTSTWAAADAVMYFTTPIVTYGQLTNAFTVASIGTATVSVAHTAHGRATGDYVNFPESPVVTGTGITLTSGKYAVTKTDADNYTVTASMVSTATASGVGGTVDYEYFLAAGNEYGLGGAGFGTGNFGSGLYGRSSSTTFDARVWTCGMFGQNVIAAPKGGGVYESSPYFTATDLAELVTNGSFAVDANWTKGANWSIAAGVATAATATSDLSQSITITAGTWNLIKLTVGYTSGTVQPKLNGSSVGSAISAAGRYFLRVWGGNGGAQTLAFTGAAFVGTLDDVSVKILGTFAPLANAPTACTGVTVSPYLHVVTWGAIPAGKSVADPMLVKTSDAEDGQTWSVAIANEAREYFLATGSRIITVVVGGQQMFALTDAGLEVASYVASPSVVWRWDPKGAGCGCIGINAAGFAAGRLWWMGNNRTFWVYDGSSVQPITCPGTKWVFDNQQSAQQDLIQFFHNPKRKLVMWSWPDKRDNTNEVSRYAAYKYDQGTWLFGSRVRTAYGEAQSFGYPMAAGTDSILYLHEKGDTADGGPLDWYARSGAFDIGDGNTLHEISGYIPDVQDQGGAYTIRFYGYEMNKNSTPEDTGALTVLPSTTSLMNFFCQGRQSEMELRGNDAPARLRWGPPRLLLQDTGNQF